MTIVSGNFLPTFSMSLDTVVAMHLWSFLQCRKHFAMIRDFIVPCCDWLCYIHWNIENLEQWLTNHIEAEKWEKHGT